jgi:radical SAM protein
MSKGVRMSALDRAPFMVFWEMTRACDLVCTHCRACAVPERAPDELSTQEGKRLLAELFDMGTRVVVLTGGDPAKRDDLVCLVRYGSALGLRMAVTFSATPLVGDGLLDELRDAGVARIALSIDGATRAKHDAFRGVQGVFDHTLDIIRAARKLEIGTQINTSVTPFNLHALPDIGEQLLSLDIELWSVFFVVPTGRASLMAAFDPDEAERALEWLDAFSTTAPFDIKTTAAPHFRRVQLQHKRHRGPHHDAHTSTQRRILGVGDGIGRMFRGINDGAGIMFISHQGDIYPSGFLPLQVGNVRRDKVAEVYASHPTMVALRDTTRLEGKCGACPFNVVCGGSRARAYAHTENLHAEDPACAYVPPHYSPPSPDRVSSMPPNPTPSQPQGVL